MFSTWFSTFVEFAGRSRLGLCRNGIGPFVFVAIYDGIGDGHIRNFMRSAITL